MRHSRTELATEGQIEQVELIIKSALRNARLDKYAMQRAIKASAELKQRIITDLQTVGNTPRASQSNHKQAGIPEETRRIREVLMADEISMIPILTPKQEPEFEFPLMADQVDIPKLEFELPFETFGS